MYGHKGLVLVKIISCFIILIDLQFCIERYWFFSFLCILYIYIYIIIIYLLHFTFGFFYVLVGCSIEFLFWAFLKV